MTNANLTVHIDHNEKGTAEIEYVKTVEINRKQILIHTIRFTYTYSIEGIEYFNVN